MAKKGVAYPGIDGKALAANVGRFKRERSKSTTVRMLRALKNEMRAGRTHGTRCLSYAPDVKVPATDKTPSHTTSLVFMQHRPRVDLLRNDLPVLMLDATGSAKLMDYSFPGITQVTIEVERNAFISQCHGNRGAMGKIGSTVTEKYRDEAAFVAHAMAKQYGNHGVVVSTKDSFELGFQRMLPEGVEGIYLGNLRGLDRLKDFDWILIAARRELSALDVERFAKALAFDRMEPLLCSGSYTEQLVGYDLASYEDRQGVMAVRHIDPLVEGIRAQFTEAETIQAIDRIRLVFRGRDEGDDPTDDPSGPCAFVMILPEAPLPGVIVDELLPYKEVVGRVGKRGGGGGPGSILKRWYADLGNVLPIQRHAWLAEKFGTTANAVNCVIKDFKTRGHGDFKKLFGAVLVYEQGVTPGTVYAESRGRAIEFSKQWREEQGRDSPRPG